MKRMFLTMLGAVAVLMLATPVLAQEAKVEKGKQVFAAQKCTTCHSIAGKGNKKGALDDVGSKLTAAQIKEWITDPVTMAAKYKEERKPPMKKKPLSNDEVDSLVAYLSTLKK